MSGWFRLTHLAGIRITGPDAIAFAHSQFTSAFNEDRQACWEPTARCNAKGRVLEVILSRVDEGRVELILPSQQSVSLVKALNLYAIGRQLQIEKRPVVSAQFRSQGELGSMLLDPTRGLSLEHPAPSENQQAERDWQLADLRAGIAWLGADTAGHFLPQALGLEERGGLSYRKGCYPGQEVIARVHYLGRLKERLWAFCCPLEAAGYTEIFDPAGQKRGQVVSALAAENDYRGLAVVASSLGADADLVLGLQALRLLEPEAL